MGRLLGFVLIASFLTQIWASGGRSPLWPLPINSEVGEDILWIDTALTAAFHCGSSNDTEARFQVAYPRSWTYHADQLKQKLLGGYEVLKRRLYKQSESSLESAHERSISEQEIIRRAVRQTLLELDRLTFVPWKFHSRHSDFEPDATQQHHRLLSLVIEQSSCPGRTTDPTTFHGTEESYRIVVDNTNIIIQTSSTLGTLRALESLKQLFYSHSSGSGTYTPYAPILIEDSPRFSHRGIGLDIARNPFTPEDVMRTIDAMATVKMNRLHLHATDSQSWPLEVSSLPDLASKGAYQPHLVWSIDELEAVLSYGDSRGVMVFVELDMPGHTGSVAQAYPDLIAAHNELDWSTFAAEPQSGQLKLNSSRVRDFLDKLFTDLLPRLKTHASLYHLGGDEVNRNVHLLDETIQSSDPKILKPLIQQIFDLILSHVSTHNLRPVVWEEMVLDWDLTLPVNTLIQVWRSSEHIEQVLRKGYPVVFGDHHHWYLDCGFGQFLDPYPQNRSPPGVPVNTSGGHPSRLQPPYLDYCNPYHNWRDIYAFNPLANVSKDLHGLIEGGEVFMWSEQTDSWDLDFKLWPRAAAAAEVLWTGPREEGKAWETDVTWRLGQWRERLVVDKGIGASPVTMSWCLMEGGCEY